MLVLTKKLSLQQAQIYLTTIYCTLTIFRLIFKLKSFLITLNV